MGNASRNKKQFHQKSLNGGAELARSEAAERFLRTFIFEEASVQKSYIFHQRSAYSARVNTLTEPQIGVFQRPVP